MRKMLPIALAALLLGPTARAEDDDPPPVRWPVLVRSASDAAGFAPPGWQVEASRSGDIDSDGVADLVIILHQHAQRNMMRGDGPGHTDLDTNPRLLLVALGRRGGPYRLLVANRSLISRWTEWNLDDHLGDLDGFVVRHGSFSVPLHLFANAGGWTSFDRDFSFRVVAGRCVLIGYDEQRLQRDTGAMTTTSIDYLTGAREVTQDSVGGDLPVRTRRFRLPRRPLLPIDQVGDGMEFEPAGK